MPSANEHFSAQFQKWERRGRGWQVFGEPVQPEPPFATFRLRSMTETPAVDCGSRPSFLGSLFRKIAAPPPPPEVEPEPEEEPEPTSLQRDSLVELQVTLPADLDMAKDSFEQLFRNLALCREPIAFELLGTDKQVVAQFAACEDDVSLVRKQLSAYFPDVQFREVEGTLGKAWDNSAGNRYLAMEFGLEQEFMLTLATGKLDPFIGIVGALAELQSGELALFQVLWQPVNESWAESIVNSVTLPDGQPLFVNAPELTRAAENKIAKSLYAVVVRILVRTTTHQRLQAISREFAGSLCAFGNAQGNALIPLHNDDYPLAEHILDIVYRQSRRSGMILNSDELIGFVHLPSSAVRSPALQRETDKTKSAPMSVRHRGLLLGSNENAGDTIEVRLSAEQRTRHIHVIGAPGVGKSTLLFNLIRQDIENHAGVAVFDPSGDLVKKILGIIPDDRIDDVILFNPADEQFHIPFNILHAHSPRERIVLASDLVSVFRRLSTSWGDQMDSVLKNAILAFLKSSRPGTLADLRRFLVEKEYRADFLQTVQDEAIRYYWEKSFPLLTGNKSVGPIVTRLNDFLTDETISGMIAQPENRLNFAEIMDTGKIFLASLPEGFLGRDNSHLIGSLLLAKFQQIAMTRQEQEMADRPNYWIYLDEFANFITPSIAEMLPGVRKYNIGLTLAHHNLHQLQRDADVANAVMSHPATRIVFKVGDEDAKKLGEGFDFFEAKNLRNLEIGQAICKVGRGDFDFNLSVPFPEAVDETAAAQRREEVIAASRKKYARAKPDATTTREIAPPKSDRPSPAKPIAETPKAAEVPKVIVPPPVVHKEPSIVDKVSEVQKVSEAPIQEERQHEVFKKEITAEAESLDYTVVPEKDIPQHGRPDLVLTRGELSIACEISDTTTPVTEADHIRLRLKAGFQHVAVLSTNRRKLSLIKTVYLEQCGDAEISKVGFYTPKEFKAQLFSWAVADPEGGKLERDKPRKQSINLADMPLTAEQRRAEELELRADLARIMAMNRKK